MRVRAGFFSVGFSFRASCTGVQTLKSKLSRGCLGETKSTVEVGLLEHSWTALQIYSRKSDNRTLICQNPQEVAFEEPVRRHLERLLTVCPNRILGFSECSWHASGSSWLAVRQACFWNCGSLMGHSTACRLGLHGARSSPPPESFPRRAVEACLEALQVELFVPAIPLHPLSSPLRLRVQSRSRTRLRIVASIAFLFRACFNRVLDTIAPLSRS